MDSTYIITVVSSQKGSMPMLMKNNVSFNLPQKSSLVHKLPGPLVLPSFLELLGPFLNQTKIRSQLGSYSMIFYIGS